MPSYKLCFIAVVILSVVVAAALATEEAEEEQVPLERIARSPKKRGGNKGGNGEHHAPCSVTCTNGGHIPTCCAAHGLKGGKCVGKKGYCK